MIHEQAIQGTRMLDLLEEVWWRYRSCPRTIESAAFDFLNRRNTQRVREVWADPESWYDFTVTDFKRRIATTYGLARCYNIETTGEWSPGWNRVLLAAAGPQPEQAAECILRRVCELAKIGR